MREAVLGLLIERPSPAYVVSLRLSERLRAAELPDNCVYWALEDLERRNLVVRGGPLAAAQAGEGSRSAPPTKMRNAIYRATPAGIAHFREWLASPAAEPPLRDDLAMRLAFCQPEDVPDLMEVATEQERRCLSRIQELQFATDETEACLPAIGSGPISGSESSGGSESLSWSEIVRGPHPSALTRALNRDAELAHWSCRIEWLQSVREMLEGLAAKTSRP